MEGQYRKRTESSTHSSHQSTRSNADSQTTSDLTSYEDACRLDPDLQSLDSDLHLRTCRAISILADGVDARSDSLLEVTGGLLDMNHPVVRFIVDSKEDMWKSKEFPDLLRKYFENSHGVDMNHPVVRFILDIKKDKSKSKQFSDAKKYFENSVAVSEFFNTVENCLRRARDSQLTLAVALLRFEEEHSAEEGISGINRFMRTLQELKRFRAAGDPFTDEVFAFYNSVEKHQMLMLEALRAEVQVGSTKKWLNSLWKRGRRDMVNSMRIWTYIAIKDLETMMILVNKYTVVMESLLQIADLENAEEEAELVLAVDEIKGKAGVFTQIIQGLSEHADKCSRDISKARAVIMRSIINH